MKILLLDLYPPLSRPFIQPYLYLGAALDALNIDYELYRWKNDEQELIEVIEQSSSKFIFINLIMGPVLSLVEPISRLIKTHLPDLKIWVGGIAVNFIAEELKKVTTIDHVSFGHPRRSLPEFVKELKDHKIIEKHAKTITRFPLLVANRYLEKFLHKHYFGEGTITTINMSTSSFCPHKCSFCYLAGRRSWAQKMECLIEDMMTLQEQYNVRYFEFSDDQFPFSEQRLKKFVRMVKESELDVSFFCLASIDQLDKKTIDLLLEGGMKRLFIGIDAFHSDLIKILNKTYTKNEIIEKVNLLRQYPIDLTLSLVLGSPGERSKHIEELFSWVSSVKPEICFTSFLTPYPGTPIFQLALNNGMKTPINLNEWAKISDWATPKTVLNPLISPEEYSDWKERSKSLATYNYRSGIGESCRRNR